jgi:MIP family channel proteins
MAGRRPRGELAGALAAELIGTYLLVFLGAGTVLATKLLLAPDAPLDATAIALAFGFAVVVAVYALGHVSGAHINPSVTVGLAAVRRFPWRAVPAYVSVQLAGALLASLTHWALFGDRARDQLFLGATTPGPRGTAIAFLAEVVITFFLVLTIVATAVDKRSPGPLAAGVAIGLVVSVGIFATLPVSGGSLNAARSFGPMLVSAEFAGWWAYLAGPLAGGILGALAYELVLKRGRPPDAKVEAE